MKALYPRWIKAIIAVLFVSVLIGGERVLAGSPVENAAFGVSSDEQLIMEMINEERGNKKLNSLIWDAKLAQLARSYSNKMARENFFSHYDLKGNNLANRAKDFNISWTGIAENLYFCQGFDDPVEAAVRGWLKSPAHRANLLNKNWSATGIGVAETADGRFYVTQIFLRR